MKFIQNLVVAILLIAGALPSEAAAQSIEDAVKTMLNPATFDPAVIDDDAEILITSGTSRRIYDADEIDQIADELKAASAKRTELSGFKVLNKIQAGQFVSIVYEFDWKSSAGNATTLTHLTAHEIWQRQPSGWRRLFAAMEH